LSPSPPLPPTSPTPERLQEARSALERARSIVVLTGAGVSSESGVPTFRDRDGIWARFDPEALATPEGFARDPRRVWEWYALRRRTLATCAPNPGHYSLARLLLRRPEVTLVTQNVDGLHERALEETDRGHSLGSDDSRKRVIRLHGNIWDTICSRCRANADSPDADRDWTDPSLPLPACSACQGPTRPGVVWFGEVLDGLLLETAFESAARAEICLVVGTSAVVYPAAGIPLATLDGGGQVMEVNPFPTPLSPRARWTLAGPSGEILPAILD
jgi:NAD-dependent deacetylase